MRQQIALLICLVGLFFGVATAGTPQPGTAPAVDKKAVRTAASKYVAAIMDYRSGKTHSPPYFNQICRRSGVMPLWKDVMAESFRLATERQMDTVLAELLRCSPLIDDSTKDAAVRGLESATPKLQHQAALWCVYHPTLVSKEAMEDARRVIREWATNPDGNPERDQIVYALMESATREDIPLIRKMLKAYDERFRDIHPKYGCQTVTSSGRGSPVKYADFVWLLCRLRDTEALHEVAEAVTQTEDPEKRAWAILLAARLWPNGFYSKAIAGALSDETVVPVPAAVGPPPGVSTQMANIASLQRFTRVCDVAVRALCDMEPPGKVAPFEAPTAKSWRLDGLSVKGLDEIADDGYHRSMEGAITMRHVVGFSPDRLKWASDYARRCQEERIKKSRSGIAPQIKVFGIDDSLMRGLVEEYARAGQAIRLLHTVSTSDVAAIGAFVGDHHPDMLLLADKPSGRAMELHGEKWLALGVDEKGQPTGGGPDEHIIAGRAVAVIVNPANKLESLTLGQIEAIFQGEVDDWAIIGGTELTPPAGPGGRPGKLDIHAFGLYARETATAIFEKEAVPRKKWKRVKYKKDTAEALAAVSMDPQAIAFVDLAAIPASGQSVKILPIKFGQGEKARNIAPTAENIKNAMYPLSQRYFLYVHPKASDTAKVFKAFTTSVLSIKAFRRAGMILLADEAITRAAKDAMAEAAAKARAEEAAKAKGKRR